MFKKTIIAISLIIALNACNLGNANGYVPTAEEIQQIRVGVDTKESVQEKFGRPAIIGETGNKWYYVSQYRVARGPLPLDETQRRGLTLHFNSNGTVVNVETFGLAEGQNVDVSNYETESGGRQLTFWDQFIGSIGNFSAENLLGGN